jgi:hypothetical protein
MFQWSRNIWDHVPIIDPPYTLLDRTPRYDGIVIAFRSLVNVTARYQVRRQSFSLVLGVGEIMGDVVCAHTGTVETIKLFSVG